jgi:dimethyladenosine transferase 1
MEYSPDGPSSELWNISPDDNPVRIVGNLPFAISTKLLLKWLRDLAARRGIFHYGRVPLILAFQTEVADRIVAPPSSPVRTLATHLKTLLSIFGGFSFPPC